jgi:hypothetical protein
VSRVDSVEASDNDVTADREHPGNLSPCGCPAIATASAATARVTILTRTAAITQLAIVVIASCAAGASTVPGQTVVNQSLNRILLPSGMCALAA